MAKEVLFHSQSAPDNFETLITNGLSNKAISNDDADLVRMFILSRPAKGMRRAKLAYVLISWRRFLKPSWKAATIDDLHQAKGLLDSYQIEDKAGNKRPFTQNTKNDFVVILKAFYTWLIKRKHSSIPLDDLKEIKAAGVNSNVTEAKDLLTNGDLGKIVAACRTPRDKALCSVLYESAGRIGEIARLRWGDVEYTESGVVKLTIHDSKAGQNKKRYAPLLLSLDFLATWRASYPGQPTNEKYIFVDTRGRPMQYRAINYVFTRAAERAGIGKRCNPHLFRKSRLTEMVRQKFQESIIKEVGWGNQSSQMMKTYVKLSSDDIIDAFSVQMGIKQKEDTQKGKVPRQCSYCLAMNSPLNEFCRKCGKPMTEEARNQQDSTMDQLISLLKQLPAEKQAELAKRL